MANDTPGLNAPEEPSNEEKPPRRMGQFNLGTDIVDSGTLGWEVMGRLQFMPFTAIYHAQSEFVHMIGTSPMFREVELEEPAPWYDIKIHFGEGDDPTMQVEVIELQTENHRPLIVMPGGKDGQ